MGLWMFGLAAVIASPALAQEGWGDEDWWQQATLADVQERLDQGAEATARASAFRTPLHEAARYSRDPAVLALLLDRGADPTVSDVSGRTPSSEAASHNANPAVLTLLLDRGVAVNTRHGGETFLHMAAQSNTPAVAALLLERGVAVNARTEYGVTALHQATQYNEDPAVTALLLDHGADPSAQETVFDSTPLEGAAMFNANPAVLALLLDRGAVDLTTPDQEEHGLLHTAAGYNNPAVAALLLDRGADATLRTKDGQLPFDLAKENEHLRGTDVYWRLNDARF